VKNIEGDEASRKPRFANRLRRIQQHKLGIALLEALRADTIRLDPFPALGQYRFTSWQGAAKSFRGSIALASHSGKRELRAESAYCEVSETEVVVA
jgi:hypothetical protein